ncbi:MAG: secretin N-terminal domain-containing protein, partial [Gammaproteobacteria bacterium]|nr:secretin N-terminal domain-containing protein [Gammaproteobacteria bacterium]
TKLANYLAGKDRTTWQNVGKGDFEEIFGVRQVIVVNDVDVASLLFAVARDAKINIDIFQNIRGKVTLNAIDQTLLQLLDRISEQVNIRYKLKDGLLVIRPDVPFFRTYKIDYVNIERSTKSKNLISTQIASAGSGSHSSSSSTSSGSSRSSGGTGNNSLTSVDSESNNAFWKTLSDNLSKFILEESDDKKENASKLSEKILVNKETGFITIKATEKQHKGIQSYIDLVLSSAKRQVLIEATIAEVTLSDKFQTGIDWSTISGSGNTTFNQSLTGANLATAPFFSATFDNGSISASVSMLETFGKVKVLSTPKVMAINNQTAILKVVDNRVYFSIAVDATTDSNSNTTKTFTTEIHTVPVGIVMQVTPYISGNDEVTLNVRPTISRIINFIEDPNPELAKEGVISKVPEIQVREVESILKVNSGDVAVIGGLMQDTVDESDSSVPFLAAIPIIGQLFNYS